MNHFRLECTKQWSSGKAKSGKANIQALEALEAMSSGDSECLVKMF